MDRLVVQAHDQYVAERVKQAAMDSDFLFVNLFRAPLGAPMKLGAVNDLLAAASRRASGPRRAPTCVASQFRQQCDGRGRHYRRGSTAPGACVNQLQPDLSASCSTTIARRGRAGRSVRSGSQMSARPAGALIVSAPGSRLEAEQAKDIWDMSQFGHAGRLHFTAINQP